MNIFNKIRDQAKDDSRRFAKGVACKIVYEPKAIGLIKKYGIVPSNVVLNGSAVINGNEFSYIDTATGKFFAIPSNSYPRYVTELNKITVVNQAPITPLTSKQSQDVVNKELEIVDYLRQILVLITIPRCRWPEGSIPNPSQYDVIIDTVDISQTMDCIFVRRSGPQGERISKW